MIHAVEDDTFDWAYTAIGASTTAFSVTLLPETVTSVEFAKYGIPPDAVRLTINYTPVGDADGNVLFPLEMQGNCPRRVIPEIVHLYPRKIGEGQVKQTEVNVFLTWVSHGPGEEAWVGLVDAVRAYKGQRFELGVVPVNAAVESSLALLLSQFLRDRKIAGASQLDDFLQDGATYSHQLNVVLPLIGTLLGLPPLSDDVRGTLNRLRKLRNEIAHTGKFEAAPTRGEVARCLSGAIFGVHCVEFRRPLMS